MLDLYLSILIVSTNSLKSLEMKICGKFPLLYFIKLSILMLAIIIFFIALIEIDLELFRTNVSYKSAIQAINDCLLLFSTP